MDSHHTTLVVPDDVKQELTKIVSDDVKPFQLELNRMVDLLARNNQPTRSPETLGELERIRNLIGMCLMSNVQGLGTMLENTYPATLKWTNEQWNKQEIGRAVQFIKVVKSTT
jgi:hypothetical protein